METSADSISHLQFRPTNPKVFIYQADKDNFEINLQSMHIFKPSMQLSLPFNWAIDTSLYEVYKLIQPLDSCAV